VTEGEKNADDLIKANLLATTVISHKWTPECASALHGYDVIILEDHDEDGSKLSAIARSALIPHAKSIRVVPTAHLWKSLVKAREIAPGDDVSDWLQLGGKPAELIKICREIEGDGDIAFESYDFPKEVDIAPYEWLLGRHMLRGEVVATAALGGTGKSSLSIIECLSMVSAKTLLHDAVPPDPLRVMLINLEDNRNTMDKRIAAAMRHYGLTQQDIGGRLFVKAKGELRFKIAETSKSGLLARNEVLIRRMVDLLIHHRIDVLYVDSLIRSHGASENDNNDMEQVIECFESIASRANCGIHLWHHFRKTNGDGVTVDSARGAKAVIDALRSVRILEKMSSEEANNLGVQSWRYFRSFSGKRNFAPPSDQSDWYRLATVMIENRGPGDGEDVGVVEKWEHPTVSFDLSPEVIARIKEEVGEKPLYRDHVLAAMWVGKVVARVLALDLDDPSAKAKVLAAIRELKKRKTLVVVPAWDKEVRKERDFVVNGNSPATVL
jgi:hypothetical protein